MKKLLWILALAAMLPMETGAVSASPADSPDSVALTYDVIYKWGFIEKVAGHGHVKMVMDQDTLRGSLDGHSIPWGGRIYTVADTLETVIRNAPGGITQNVLYANGWYSKPLAGSASGADLSDPANYRTTSGAGELSASSATIEAVTITTDMIGFFYLCRLLDFGSMTEGQVTTLPVSYQGGADRKLEITYNGTSESAGTQVYDVVFNYSYNGQMSEYPVSCLVDKKSRIPMSVSAKLLIGHMEMVYSPDGHQMADSD